MDEQRRAVSGRETVIHRPKEDYGAQKFGNSAQSNECEKKTSRGENLSKHCGKACNDGSTQPQTNLSDDEENMKNSVAELENAGKPKIVRQPEVEENESPKSESSPSSGSPSSLAILENDYADGNPGSIANDEESSNGFENKKSRRSGSPASSKAIRTEPYSSRTSVEDLPRDGSKELSFRKTPTMLPRAETENFDQSSVKNDHNSPNSHCSEACECCPIILPVRLSAKQRELQKIAQEVNERKVSHVNRTSPTDRREQTISANEQIQMSSESEGQPIKETTRPVSKGPSPGSSNSPIQLGEAIPASVRRSRSTATTTSTLLKCSPLGKDLVEQGKSNATRSPKELIKSPMVAVQLKRFKKNKIPTNPPPTPATPIHSQGPITHRPSTSSRLHNVNKMLNVSPSKIQNLIEGGPPSGSTRSKTAARKRPLSSSSNNMSSSSGNGTNSLKNRRDNLRKDLTNQKRSITESGSEASRSSSRSEQSSSRGKRRGRPRHNVEAKPAETKKAAKFVTKTKSGSNSGKHRNHSDKSHSLHGVDFEAARSSSLSRQSRHQGNRKPKSRSNVKKRSVPASKTVKFVSKARPGPNFRKSRSPAVQSRSHNSAIVSSNSESSRSSPESERFPQRRSKRQSKAVDKKESKALRDVLPKHKIEHSSKRLQSSSRYGSSNNSDTSNSRAGPSTSNRAGRKQHRPSGPVLPRKRGPNENQYRRGARSDSKRKR